MKLINKPILFDFTRITLRAPTNKQSCQLVQPLVACDGMSDSDICCNRDVFPKNNWPETRLMQTRVMKSNFLTILCISVEPTSQIERGNCNFGRLQLCPLWDVGPEVQFYLLYNSWNCLGMNALQRLIHKINWPEIHWSCRQSVSPFVCLSLLSLPLSLWLFCANTLTQTVTNTRLTNTHAY